jgi:hypothetical protein
MSSTCEPRCEPPSTAIGVVAAGFSAKLGGLEALAASIQVAVPPSDSPDLISVIDLESDGSKVQFLVYAAPCAAVLVSR